MNSIFKKGLSATKAHNIILKRIGSLPEGEKQLLLAKYEGAETPQLQSKNNVLMMLLRAHLEQKQRGHSHATKWVLKNNDVIESILKDEFKMNKTIFFFQNVFTNF